MKFVLFKDRAPDVAGNCIVLDAESQLQKVFCDGKGNYCAKNGEHYIAWLDMTPDEIPTIPKMSFEEAYAAFCAPAVFTEADLDAAEKAAIAALKKQIAESVQRRNGSVFCPDCGAYLGELSHGIRFCPCCGKHIDWR